MTRNGRLIGSTQTAYVLTLMFDLAQPEDRQKVAKLLVQDLEARGIHLSTGFVGTPYLCLVLSRFGYHDLAGKLVQQEDYPSWLYAVKKGCDYDLGALGWHKGRWKLLELRHEFLQSLCLWRSR